MTYAGWHDKEEHRLAAQADPETCAAFDRLVAESDAQEAAGHDAKTPVEDSDEPMLELIDFGQVHDPTDDLVEGLIIPGRWTQFVAPAKGSKSSPLMFMALMLSEGFSPFDGTADEVGYAIDPVRVLYCDGEMGRPDVEALIADCGRDPTTLTGLWCSEHHVRLDTEIGAGMLLRRVDQLGVQLLILDGVNGFVNPAADENSSSTWNPLFDLAIVPLKARGIAIASADNFGKDWTRGSRGASLKTDKADCVIRVTKTDGPGAKFKATHRRGGLFLDELDLLAEGFDRSKPIRYWRSPLGGWPAGTKDAVAMLDRLNIPLDVGNRKAREFVREAKESISNEVLAAAIRFRRTNVIRPRQQP